ncbi:MAG: stage II sporulation protein M [Candidatus Aenigmarchaeota archaeon]|nr:stage II sporulation protein M [Candidatus Aenigmarchaeota archaeon]
MVFENILNYKVAEKKATLVFIYSLILSSVSLFVAYFIFPQSASVIFLFLITLSSAQMVYNELKEDEEEDEKHPDIDMSFMKRNERVIKVYFFLFLGCLVAVSFWHSVLPSDKTSVLFTRQIETIDFIRSDGPGSATGNAIAGQFNSFTLITKNNFKVMTIAFIFSFVFGSGALFIIFWNASVIGVFVSQMAVEIGHLGIPGMAHTLALTSICFHGVPEALAYFVAGIAGGILSIGIIKGKHDKIIMKDAFVLFCASLLLVFISGFIEVWITPIL